MTSVIVWGSLDSLSPDVVAQAYLVDGYRSISNKFRTAPRLPPGKSGLEALAEVDPHHAEKLLEEVEERATEAYLRVHAREAGNTLELDPDTFLAFKRLQNGGR